MPKTAYNLRITPESNGWTVTTVAGEKSIGQGGSVFVEHPPGQPSLDSVSVRSFRASLEASWTEAGWKITQETDFKSYGLRHRFSLNGSSRLDEEDQLDLSKETTLVVLAPRFLHLCFDGTWTAESKIANVYQLFLSLNAREEPENTAEEHPDDDLKVYFVGLGKNKFEDSSWVTRPFKKAADLVAGGGFGVGLSNDIRGGFAWLVKNYIEGDRIHVYGFSRGAYISRSLAGMLGLVGLALLPTQLTGLERVAEAAKRADVFFDAYHGRDPQLSVRSEYGWLDIPDASRIPVDVNFLGVFDTVGSVGIPLRETVRDASAPKWVDIRLGNHVRHARHALALDERRNAFNASMWNAHRDTDSQQVWFSGDHSDIGGAHFGKWGLGHCALAWMMTEVGSLMKFELMVVPGPDELPTMDYPEGSNLSAVLEEEFGLFKFSLPDEMNAPCTCEAHPTVRDPLVHVGLTMPQALTVTPAVANPRMDKPGTVPETEAWSNALESGFQGVDQAEAMRKMAQAVKGDSGFAVEASGAFLWQNYRHVCTGAPWRTAAAHNIYDVQPFARKWWQRRYRYFRDIRACPYTSCCPYLGVKAVNDQFLASTAVYRMATDPEYQCWSLISQETVLMLDDAFMRMNRTPGMVQHVVAPDDGSIPWYENVEWSPSIAGTGMSGASTPASTGSLVSSSTTGSGVASRASSVSSIKALLGEDSRRIVKNKPVLRAEVIRREQILPGAA